VNRNSFDRCGLASLDDLETDGWKACFEELESSQAEFLAHEDRFRSPSYPWPRDCLHNWSRAWEYPYVLHHLQTWRAQLPSGCFPLTMDLGSGVTFYPFFLARKGYRVLAIDTDPVCGRDFTLACRALDAPPGRLSFRQGDARAIPVEEHSVDAVYSISVLEHIPRPEQVIGEVARVLRHDGLFVVTIDVGLEEAFDVSPAVFSKLQLELARFFVPAAPERSIHPRRLLTTERGPFPLVPRRNVIRRIARGAKRSLQNRLGKGRGDPEYRLACYGFAGTPRT